MRTGDTSASLSARSRLARRSACRQLYEEGTLLKPVSPARQVARLLVAGLGPTLGRWRRSLGDVLYAGSSQRLVSEKNWAGLAAAIAAGEQAALHALYERTHRAVERDSFDSPGRPAGVVALDDGCRQDRRRCDEAGEG